MKAIIRFLVPPILLALALWYVVWGGYEPRLAGATAAMWDVGIFSGCLLLYLTLQAVIALNHPPGRALSWAYDIMGSVLPAFTACAALLGWWFAGKQLTDFQQIAVFLTLITALIDLFVFTWFVDRALSEGRHFPSPRAASR